jgi:hypothetical protein
MQIGRLVSSGLTASLIGFGSVVLPPVQESHALCLAPSPDFTGSWRNVDSSTRGVTQLKITYECSDVRYCDAQTGRCTSGSSGYFLRAYGACVPRDCDWGQVQATTYPIITTISSLFPRIRITQGLRAFYNQGFAQRTLSSTIVESGSQRGQLKLTVSTIYTDRSGRANRTDTYYFTK